MTKFRKTSEIRLNPANPRIIRDEKYRVLVRSVAQFPKMLDKRGIVVDGSKMILGGNQRWRAILDILKMPESELTALLNGDTETFARWEILREKQAVPENWIVDGSDMTDDEIRRFIIADNVEMGEHDWDMLANGWDADELEGWGVVVPDFAGGGSGEAHEDDYEMPDEIQTDIVAGDLFEIGTHRLLCGDSTKKEDVEILMRGEMSDMVFTDPPHDLNDFDVIVMSSFFCSGVKFILHNDKYLAKLATKYIERFERFFVHDFIFHIGGGNRFFTQNDLIGCFDYSSERFVGLSDGFSTVIRKMTERQKGTDALPHPHAKPVYLVEQFILHFTNKNNLVLDLFLGSGTTMLTAHQLDRRCYGIEIEPKYCQVIVDRMIKLNPELEIKKNGQPYFTAIVL